MADPALGGGPGQPWEAAAVPARGAKRERGSDSLGSEEPPIKFFDSGSAPHAAPSLGDWPALAPSGERELPAPRMPVIGGPMAST